MRDDILMERCLELAQKGAGYVSPNPLVGCVIVKDRKVVAEGFHKEFGKPHAEIEAITNASKKGIDLEGADMYVNLEPCVHYGKTPPCVDKIISNKFRKVIIGTADPNPLVRGGGIRKLKANGVRVAEGVLSAKCEELNRFFLKYIRTGLPYVTLKAAVSLDGKIADRNLRSKWISSGESRTLVHKFRSEYDAVLVGKRTVEIDNPALTVRHIKGRNPNRIVIDKNLSTSLDKKIFIDKYHEKTMVLFSERTEKAKELESRNIALIKCITRGGKINLKDALRKVGRKGISSILVEGGSETLSEFLNQKMVDEILIFISPKVIGKGLDVFKTEKLLDFSMDEITYKKSGKDLLVRVRIRK